MIDAATKELVARRARWACEYCRSQVAFSPDPFSIEHILPRAQGHTDAPDNLAFSCQGCNNHKYTHTTGLDTATGEYAPLYHPRRQTWHEHFVWNEDFTWLLGLTPTGRATLERLRLNRTGVVNLRSVLAESGRHPPADAEL